MAKAKQSGRRIAVIGYGSQGHALAQNWRESCGDVLVALSARSSSNKRARSDGFRPVTVAAATRQSDIVVMAFPDYLHGRVFRRQIAPHLHPGQSLLFLHGLSVHFGQVVAPPECDVLLLAPHAPGVTVRQKYLGARDLSAFIGVHQNATGHAWTTIRRLAAQAGFDKSRCLKTTFEDEAIGDLFGEQAVLCGGLAMLIKSGFETLIEQGLPPDNAYLEVAYQLDLIVDLIKRYGIAGMFDRISVAAQLGSLKAGPDIIGPDVKKRMRAALESIVDGSFVGELSKLDSKDLPRLRRQLLCLSHPDLERAAKKFAPSESHSKRKAK
ncbi:MAG: ketol-acid reductoisomerase [bacterium]